MDLEKLTDRARGFLQAAQTIAVREHHQRITPAHYAKALLDDEQGMAVGLINAAGVEPAIAAGRASGAGPAHGLPCRPVWWGIFIATPRAERCTRQ